METWFNRNPVVVGEQIPDYSQDSIENTLNLRQASLEDAARYGGPITRAALGAMNFKDDREHIVVDTKVNLLLPGFIPAIPGWHTDGVPRGDSLNPAGKGDPKISAQIDASLIEQAGDQQFGLPRSSHYHLLVTGTISQTEFINNPLYLHVEDGPSLYESMTRDVDELIDREIAELFVAPSNTVVEWDWWNIHRAVPSTGRGWRYLIRVTESDSIMPRTDPNDFIRTQSQVYVPVEFGW